ncbi:beta-glucosidase [Thermoflavifilum thermophilum]|uniref:Beta-glucosidase n=1 Tax=Thermoflavifilum thermophilum TaxID=1393122 RepID=A0A1I7NGH7_9BACT|nr:glycoside hydrolase family 3 C-terminal domain-containing protein [Thermoflavifilum thermophilum]SFV33765.1 beta-glucosidase [Thermoflavifilum thermophilum]
MNVRNLRWMLTMLVSTCIPLWLTAQTLDDSTIYRKADSLIALMTLEEKVNMIHASSSFTSGGVPRLGIPELVMSDGPHGVRMEHGRGWTELQVDDSVTYLPVGVCLAATWNPQLGYAFGTVLGSEANARGKDVILGPGICVIRTPLNGRNFEYMSEDPYLISKMVVGYIQGVQSQGIAACVKHYLANNQETDRFTINVDMPERALQEIYLPGYKAAVQQGHVLTLMGAYNKFRGQYCTENAYLIHNILKSQLGFKGLVVSDWGAVHNTMEALMNGTDLEMGTDLSMLPHPDYHKFFMGDTVISLVKQGIVPESVVDEKVRRILYVMFKVHKFDSLRPKGVRNTPEHQAIALKVAEEGIVLLKNDQHLLPFNAKKIKTIAVIGASADWKNARAGGSSQVPALFEITPLQGIRDLVGNRVRVVYAPGYRIARGFHADPTMIQQAVEAARKADIVIYVGGWIHGYSDAWDDNAFDAEGVDKPNMYLPFDQDTLMEAVLKANPRTAIVLMGGGPVDMTRWIEQAPAIVQAWYPGMEGGKAIAEILFGQVNPSGKLPMTFPKTLADNPTARFDSYPGKNGFEYYSEGLFVGYRYYDTYHVQPQFCFGHGLSYTTFAYDQLQIEKSGPDSVTVRFTLQNTGKMAGAEVAQVYVHEEHPRMVRPEKELKGFQKVFLQPGESRTVTIGLPRSAFSYFDDHRMQWVMDPARFDILIGSSSEDIRLKGQVDFE